MLCEAAKIKYKLNTVPAVHDNQLRYRYLLAMPPATHTTGELLQPREDIDYNNMDIDATKFILMPRAHVFYPVKLPAQTLASLQT